MNEVNKENNDAALGDAEIASIIEVSKKAIYQKNQKAPTRDTKNFTARKLVDIAFEAEEKRKAFSTKELEEAEPDAEEKIGQNKLVGATLRQEPSQINDAVELEDEEKKKLNEQIKNLENEISIQKESNELKVKLAEETGFSRGLSEGMTKTEIKLKEELDKKIKALENIIKSFSTRTGTDVSKINDAIEEAVKRIAGQRIQIEILENPKQISDKIQNLAKMIVNATETPRIRLNIEDFELVQPFLNDEEISFKLIKDPHLSSGDAILESGTIELRDVLEERFLANPIEVETKEKIANISEETAPKDETSIETAPKDETSIETASISSPSAMAPIS